MANNIIKRIWNQNTLVNIEVLKGAAFQDEDGGHTFEISGVDNSGNAISLSGTVAGVFLRPDNTDVPITGSASGGIVSVTLPAECYDVPGRFGLTVFVTADSQKTCVYAAIGTVGRTSSGSVAPGTSADVVDLINQISAAVATIPASWSGLMADIAPTYSTSAAYPVGAYVYYNGDLYRCTTAITSGETWTAAHWTTAVLGNDVSDLKNAISDSQGNVIPSAELKGEIDELQSEYLVYEKDNNITVANIENTMPGNIAITATPYTENRFLPNPYGEQESVTKNGVTFTRDQNGIITINGTPSAFTRYYIIGTSPNQKWPVESGKITISFISSQPLSFEYYYDSTPSADRPHINRKTYGTMTLDAPAFADYSRVVVDLYLITGVEYKDCKVYVSLETGETNHNDAICVVNKNLIGVICPIRLDSTYTSTDSETGVYHGITYSVDYDAGTITLNGTADASFYFVFYALADCVVPISPGTLCMLTGSATSSTANGYWMYVTFKDIDNNTLFQVRDYYKSNTLISEEYVSISAGIRVVSGAVLNNVVFTPMLEIGKQRTNFVKQEMQMYNPFFGETNTLRSYSNSTSLYSRNGALSFSATVPISYPQYSQSIFGSDVREITVCTYNVGVWNYGDRNNPLYHGNDLPGVISLLKQFLADGNIDVLAMQEYRDFIDPEKTYRTITELFEPVFSEYFRGNTSEIVFSRYLFQNRFKGYVGDSVNRGYMIHDITVGSTTVRIINTHLIYNDATERTVEMQQIVDRALTEYTVIMGDFNVHDFSEYAPFVTAGLIPANGGYFGDFITTKTSGGKYDNVWVTPNIQIVNVWQADKHESSEELDIPSDHLPLLAKLIIHGSTNNTDSEDWEEN